MCNKCKKHLKKCRNSYYDAYNKKRCTLKPKNPKEFWNILKDKTDNISKLEVSFVDMVNHFKELNKSDDDSQPPDFQNFDNPINSDFTLDEIKRAIKKLKRNKACGIDGIVNEFLLYLKLFNIVINTGLVPDGWGIGIITPVYKSSGPAEDPCNYRGISKLHW